MKSLTAPFFILMSLSCFAQESVSFIGTNTRFSSSLNNERLVGLDEQIKVQAKLYRPDTAELSPAVIILHGSSGITNEREIYYAEQLKKQGYVVLVINSFDTRSNQPKEKVSVLSQTADAIAGLNYISSIPSVDKNKIFTLGFSMGGHASYYLSDKSILEHYKSPYNFRAHINFYHNCHITFEEHNPTNAKVISIFGDKDEYIDIEACQVEFAKKKIKGGHAEIHIIKDAAHAWELGSNRHWANQAVNRKNCILAIKSNGSLVWKTGESLSAKNYKDCETRGYTIGYDPKAKKEAETILYNFLKKEQD